MITTRCIFLTVLGLLSMVAWAQERPDQSSLDTLNWDEIRYAAFHSDTISMENWRSFSLPVNTMVDSRAGVRVRQNAATGSNFSYELDGLNSVSYFLDGLPIRYMGSAMQINNMPTALLDKVEVFKGVTPVYLGSDGLGGTVNMVTRKVDSSFISASYAYGSFNTQQAHLQGQWTNKRSGFTVKAMTYFTDAENNYEIDVDVPNQTGFIERISAERFNDDFRSLFGKIDLGFTNVSWADELFVGLVVSDLEEGIQTGSDLAIPLGDVQRDEEFLMPAITYKKNDIFVKGLSLDLFGSYAMTKRTFTDTSSFVYNWRGERILTRAFPGELVNGGSLNEVEDKALIVRVFPQFQFSDDHKIVLNYTLEDLERESEDEFNPLPFSSEPTKYTTHTAGLGWQGNWLQGRLYSNLFAKYFRFNSSATQMAFAGSQELEGDDSQVGFGLATSYKINQWATINASLERAVRLPQADELFGDGAFAVPNVELESEKSLNINLGVSSENIPLAGDHTIGYRINGVYRNVEDYIVFQSSGSFITATNFNDILIKGIEAGFSYRYKELLHFTFNKTYLDIRDNRDDRLDPFFEERIPDVAHDYMNATLTLKFGDLFTEDSELSTYWQWNSVSEFDLLFGGLSNSQFVIPTQNTINVGLSYQLPTPVSLSLDVMNVFEEEVFDRFRFQRPGRSFQVRLGYNL